MKKLILGISSGFFIVLASKTLKSDQVTLSSRAPAWANCGQRINLTERINVDLSPNRRDLIFEQVVIDKSQKPRNIEEIISDYSKSNKVQELITIALNNFSDKHFHLEISENGCCAAFVSSALYHSYLTQDRIYAHANQMYSKLKERGWVNLMAFNNGITNYNSRNAPNGAILIYKGGAYGHVEIKAGKEYVSDYHSTTPLDEIMSSKILIAIMIKP